MAKRLTFSEFQNGLENRSLPTDSLSDYLEFDAKSPIPTLVFRYDALLDPADAEYNVDIAICNYLQELDEKEYFQTADYQLAEKKSVVAEGDCWYKFPFHTPLAIADWIKRNQRFHMRNIACWGHTISKIYNDQQYMKVLENIRPDCFMLCGGGNDLQQGVKNGSYLHSYDPRRAPDDYLTKDGIDKIEEIKETYVLILQDVTKEFSKIRIFCHGYDYPRPLVGQGYFIGQYLCKLGIPDKAMNSIVVAVVDRLNLAIQEAIKSFRMVEFVDLRRATDAYKWHDDMHPDCEGFRALAEKFEDAMS